MDGVIFFHFILGAFLHFLPLQFLPLPLCPSLCLFVSLAHHVNVGSLVTFPHPPPPRTRYVLQKSPLSPWSAGKLTVGQPV